jgi:hypothetical protein
MKLRFIIIGLGLAQDEPKMSDKMINKKIETMKKQKELGDRYIYKPNYIKGYLQPPKYSKKWFSD